VVRRAAPPRALPLAPPPGPFACIVRSPVHADAPPHVGPIHNTKPQVGGLHHRSTVCRRRAWT
jgi:hypothetical protein